MAISIACAESSVYLLAMLFLYNSSLPAKQVKPPSAATFHASPAFHASLFSRPVLVANQAATFISAQPATDRATLPL
jgi:hypothetical protein